MVSSDPLMLCVSSTDDQGGEYPGAVMLLRFRVVRVLSYRHGVKVLFVRYASFNRSCGDFSLRASGVEGTVPKCSSLKIVVGVSNNPIESPKTSLGLAKDHP